ncbi:MAG: ABC transporter ATP-binding protein [Oscillospiraceae bacterium]
MAELVLLKDITKIYNQGRENAVMALHNVNLALGRGETVAIQGASGSGKSTLLRIIGCLDRSTAGEYIFGGTQVQPRNSAQLASLRGKRIGFIMQQYALVDEQTVLENVALPMLFTKRKLSESARRAEDMLIQLHMQHLAKKKVRQLSGGEKQRVAIARALVNDPELILADEPTGALDSVTGMEVVQRILSLKEKGRTIIIVTHNPEIAAMCEKNFFIKDGRLSEFIIRKRDSSDGT